MAILLDRTPDAKHDLILVGTTIRKPLVIVAAYLRRLAAQQLPSGVVVRYHFICDSAAPEVVDAVQAFVATHGGVCEVHTGETGDFADTGSTHHWQASSMERVGHLKDRIFQAAKAQRAAVWLCDADLLCDPKTLYSLWSADVPIACAVYWTRWVNDAKIHAAPQVWLRHPYELTGRGYPDEASFRTRLQTRELTQVWGQGACTLIRLPVLEAGVTFARLPGISTEGMMAGEDRHFCIHAEAKHIPMFADPWPHLFHVYHPHQIAEIPEREQQLGALHAGKPVWVSLRLRALEPLPVGPGQVHHLPPLMVRAKLGTDTLLPDLEQQVLRNLHGQPFVASVHYPSTYPVTFLRGQRRLLDVTVIDTKNGAGMPVLNDERSGPYDLTLYSPEQQESMRAGT